MEKVRKPSLIRRLVSYVVAASVFLLVFEVLFQILSLIKTGALLPLDKAHIACSIFTFKFLLLSGFIMVGLGHLMISVFRIQFQKVKTRHAFAYALGYMVFLCIGVFLSVKLKPELADIMIASWPVHLLSAFLMFVVALIAGRSFAQVYEGSSKLKMG